MSNGKSVGICEEGADGGRNLLPLPAISFLLPGASTDDQKLCSVVINGLCLDTAKINESKLIVATNEDVHVGK